MPKTFMFVSSVSRFERKKKGGRKIGFHAKARKGAKISLRLDTNARGENLRRRLSRVYDAASLEQFRHRH